MTSVRKHKKKTDGFNARKEGFSKSPLVHHLSDEELQQLKAILLTALSDFNAVAEKYHIFYTASGGTILGCIRHHGFIPWDDDIDLMMPRKDFDLLKTVFNRELGDRYSLCAPELGQGHGLSVCQIKRKGTILRSYNEISKDDAGIPIDIFVLENTYDSPILRLIHGVLCLGAGFLLNARKTYNDMPFLDPYLEGNPGFKQSFRKKLRLGKILSFLSLDQLSRFTYRVYSICRDHNSRYVSIPSGRKHFFGELYLRSDMCNALNGEFEGQVVPIPVGYKTYLNTLYGANYMELPPVEDRERHPVMELSFGDVKS